MISRKTLTTITALICGAVIALCFLFLVLFFVLDESSGRWVVGPPLLLLPLIVSWILWHSSAKQTKEARLSQQVLFLVVSYGAAAILSTLFFWFIIGRIGSTLSSGAFS